MGLSKNISWRFLLERRPACPTWFPKHWRCWNNSSFSPIFAYVLHWITATQKNSHWKDCSAKAPDKKKHNNIFSSWPSQLYISKWWCHSLTCDGEEKSGLVAPPFWMLSKEKNASGMKHQFSNWLSDFWKESTVVSWLIMLYSIYGISKAYHMGFLDGTPKAWTNWQNFPVKTSYCRVPGPFSFCRHPVKLKGGLVKNPGQAVVDGWFNWFMGFQVGLFSISKVGDFDVQLHGFLCRNTWFDTSRTHQHLGLMSNIWLEGC